MTAITTPQSDEIIRLVAKLTGRRVRRLDDPVVADTIDMRVAHIRRGITKAEASAILDVLRDRVDDAEATAARHRADIEALERAGTRTLPELGRLVDAAAAAALGDRIDALREALNTAVAELEKLGGVIPRALGPWED